MHSRNRNNKGKSHRKEGEETFQLKMLPKIFSRVSQVLLNLKNRKL